MERIRTSDIKEFSKKTTLGGLASFLDIDPATVSRWDYIPQRYHRDVLAWIEDNGDELVDLAEKIVLK